MAATSSDHLIGTSIPLPGTPEGLVAYVRPRPDGSVPRDRRGRVKATRVTLAAQPDTPADLPGPGDPVSGITAADLAWVTGAGSRQRAGITGRFGDRADQIAFALAAAGVVHLDCQVTDHATLGEIRGWRLTVPWHQYRLDRAGEATRAASAWVDRAHSAADEVAHRDPGLAVALRETRGTSPLLPVLVHAAEDLAAGVSHDGPRAFSQTHFGDTKARDDVAVILADAGAATDTVVALGLARSPYLGVGGPVRVHHGDRVWDLAGVAGPVLFRATDHRPLTLSLHDPAGGLVIVENKQAAEATCDGFPGLPVLYCAGQPADPVLRAIGTAAAETGRVWVATDADLGGVRIAQRLLSVLPTAARVSVLDAGEGAHTPGEPFGEGSLAGLRTLAQTSGPVGVFARACLDRGYRVEQEAAIRSALTTALRGER